MKKSGESAMIVMLPLSEKNKIPFKSEIIEELFSEYCFVNRRTSLSIESSKSMDADV